MNMNIYITKDNEERLRGLGEWTMSGLVNYLLTAWFKNPEHSANALKEKVEKPALKKFPVAMAKPLPKPPIEIVRDLFPKAQELCKIHGIPMTTQGKCLQKGCKYS